MSDGKTTILLIRHGETDWNAAGRWQGHSDIPLNDNGRRQSQALAQRLAAWPIQALYTSDLKRAKETADIIAHSHEITPVLDAALRERYGGFFQGLTGEEIRSTYAAQWKMLIEGHDLEGIESNTAAQERIWHAFEKITATHQGEMIAFVSHGATLGLLIAKALGFTLAQRPRFTMRQNTGLSIIELDDNGPLVTLLNDASHLNNW